MSAAPQTIQKASAPAIGHARAFSRFLVAALYFLLARAVAQRGAAGLVSLDWVPLVTQAMLAFLLIVGYAGLGFLLERQNLPVAQQGLALRRGWISEAGLGLAIGWTIAVVCLLPILALGGVVLRFSINTSSVGWLFADAAYFVLQTLVIQIAFRGYPAECATRAIGELPGVLMLATLYAILEAQLPGSTPMSVLVSFALGLTLSLAYLRTRALWLPWGLQFGWLASRALLFGLPVEGNISHSPVVQGYPTASSFWTGSDFGLDGTLVAFLAFLVAMPFLYRATRELSYRYNAPILIPGGIPVDLDAAARSQHEAATRPDVPEIKPLVQILPASAPPPRPVMPNHVHDASNPSASNPSASNPSPLATPYPPASNEDN